MRRLTIAFLSIAALPMLGHHTFSSEFDASKPLNLTGKVSKVEWQDPHVYIYLDVKTRQAKRSNGNWKPPARNTSSSKD